MNVYDSGRMADVLAPLGYSLTADPAGADMVILNTCHIRDRAAEKVFSELGKLRLIKLARAAEGRPYWRSPAAVLRLQARRGSTGLPMSTLCAARRAITACRR